MGTVIKRKFKIGVALLCTIMLLLSIIPTSLFGGWEVGASDTTPIYFDTYVNSSWQNYNGWTANANVGVYVFNSSTKTGTGPVAMEDVSSRITSKGGSGYKVYKYDVDTSSYDSVIFVNTGTSWGVDSQQTVDVKLSDYTGNCFKLNGGASGSKKTVEAYQINTSVAGSIINFVDMTGEATVTYSFSIDGNNATAQSSVASGGSITVPGDIAAGAYNQISFYANGELTGTYDLYNDYDSSTANTFYYGSVVDKATGKSVKNYWETARNRVAYSHKVLYLDKGVFPDSLTSVTIAGAAAEAVEKGNARWKSGNISGNEDSVVSVDDGSKIYNFYLDASSRDNLVTLQGGVAVVSGEYTATEEQIIYFDATLSKLVYEEGGRAIPSPSKVYYATDKDEIGEMQLAGPNNDGKITAKGRELSNIYQISLNDKTATQIRFSYFSPSGLNDNDWDGGSTIIATIPTDKDQPCFFADTGDDTVYNHFSSNLRGGYWGELGDIRDAESGKSTDVVPITSSAFTRASNTKYVNSTFYDYYSDYELNGKDRVDYDLVPSKDDQNQRRYSTFRQFAQALSDYYSSNHTPKNNAIYTGHFQPNVTGWGSPFSDISELMNLYGWENGDNMKAFQSNNNSTQGWDDATNNPSSAVGSGAKYRYATQNILKNQLDGTSNLPYIYNTNVLFPYFDTDFINGENSKNTKLGDVYENVAFPFTKVDRDDNGVLYWSFDSAATTVHMEQNDKSVSSTGKYDYYLKTLSQATVTDERGLTQEASRSASTSITTSDTYTANADRGYNWSKNVDSSSVVSNADGVSNKYGFFPLNNQDAPTNANRYNYGFGTKLEFKFTLSDDGNVVDKDGNKVPITFNFSGDDDVWVYIDGKLALDIGGDHGRTSGCINFSNTKAYDYCYSYKDDSSNFKVTSNSIPVASVFVSEVKKSANNSNQYTNVDNSNPVTTTLSSLGLSDLTTGTHTLTFFYMERGQWESNLKLQFNFPDSDTLELEKEVDTSNVNTIFDGFFEDQSIFRYTVQNYATHYGTKAVSTEIKTYDPITVGDNFTGTLTKIGSNIFEKLDSYASATNVAHYWAKYNNGSTSDGDWQNYTDKRLGTFTLDSGVSLDAEAMSVMSELTFKVYSSSDIKENNMYIILTDGSGKTAKGYLIGGKTFSKDGWRDVSLSLSTLSKESGFDITTLRSIGFAYDYEQSIYLDSFIFKSSAVNGLTNVGFQTNQADIPDYQSVKNGKLMNVKGAVYTSSEKAGNLLVGEDGAVTLENKESVLFNNQFRRGSYVSIVEELTENQQKLFVPEWTLYESDAEVVEMTDGATISNPASFTNPGQQGTGFDDGRQEVYTSLHSNTGYTRTHKPTEPTIVLRSYTVPDEDSVGTQLKLKNTNKVNVGSLTFEKKQSERSDGELTGTYQFVVEFSNIGGIGLKKNGESTVRRTYEIGKDGKVTITGIPVGTEYTIYEIDPTDNSSLDEVRRTAPDEEDLTSQVVDKKVDYDGDGTEENAHAYSSVISENSAHYQYRFFNAVRDLIELNMKKVWDVPDGVDLPDKVYFSLMYKAEDETTWKPVSTYDKFALNAIAFDEQTEWTKTFTNLPAHKPYYQTSGSNVKYIYKVVEYAYDETKPEGEQFTELHQGDKNFVDYVVSYGTPEGTSEDHATLTVTNKYEVNPIIMPETGGSGNALNIFALFGGFVVLIAGGALIIYRRKLQYAYINVDGQEGN